MKTSVVITNYKYNKWLPQAVVSCEEADEITVVFDKPQIPGQHYISKAMFIYNDKNMGVSYSRNRGIKESTGDIILILDADDYLTPQSISKRLRYFEEESIDIVHGPVLRFDDGKDNFKRHPSLLTFQGVMIRRRVFEKFGLYHEKLRSAEDKEMLYRWGMHRNSPLKQQVKAVKVDFPVAYYRRHAGSKRKSRKVSRDFDIRTHMEFDSRIKDLELNGITPENTEFL